MQSWSFEQLRQKVIKALDPGKKTKKNTLCSGNTFVLLFSITGDLLYGEQVAYTPLQYDTKADQAVNVTNHTYPHQQ